MFASTIRPAAIPVVRTPEIDNPAMTRLLHLGIAAAMLSTIIVFRGALFALLTSALPFA